MPVGASCVLSSSVHEQQHALFAGALSELRRLEDLDAAVVAFVDGVLLMLPPILLMLETGVLAVEVPGRAGHILWDMGVDSLSILIHRSGREAGLPGLLQLLVTAEVLMGRHRCPSLGGGAATCKGANASRLRHFAALRHFPALHWPSAGCLCTCLCATGPQY